MPQSGENRTTNYVAGGSARWRLVMVVVYHMITSGLTFTYIRSLHFQIPITQKIRN